MSFARKLLFVLSAFALFTAAVPVEVDAHSAGNVQGYWEGKKRAPSDIWTITDDLDPDGHCTYVRFRHNGVWSEGAKSCGPVSGKLDTVSNVASWTYYEGCITGHWKCVGIGWVSSTFTHSVKKTL